MLPDLSHEAKVVLYTMGALAELQQADLVGGLRPVTVKGLGWFDQLDASGFRPTDAEIRKALAAYCGFKNLSAAVVPDELVLLISRWKEAIAVEQK